MNLTCLFDEISNNIKNLHYDAGNGGLKIACTCYILGMLNLFMHNSKKRCFLLDNTSFKVYYNCRVKEMSND